MMSFYEPFPGHTSTRLSTCFDTLPTFLINTIKPNNALGGGLLSDRGRKVLKVVQGNEFNTFRKGEKQ
jgi:hypothetical protein